MPVGNPQYRDRLFQFIFGSEENKAWTLSLYNAIRGTDYADPEAIRITTIREVMYLGMHNDVSFMISENIRLLPGEMNLFEQQSSYNPNMPLRMMQYASNLYEKYIVENKLNKYGSGLISLPVPKLVVFYNGKADQPNDTILQLSDSFDVDPDVNADPDIAVKVRMINVNYNGNTEVLNACRPLKEYAWIVDQIRAGKGEIDYAIDKAISDMPDEFMIKPYLMTHRAEVKGMLLTEYNEAAAMELFKEDGRREGRLEGRMETLTHLVKRQTISVEEAAKEMGMTTTEFITEMQKVQE